MSSRSVVLVDDNEALLSGVSELLRQQDLEVFAFTDFESARHHLHHHQPSALVTDVRLGAFNGLHLVLLAKQWAPNVAAFVYSAHADPIIRDEALRAGAEYVAKDDIVSVLVPHLLQKLSMPTNAA